MQIILRISFLGRLLNFIKFVPGKQMHFRIFFLTALLSGCITAVSTQVIIADDSVIEEEPYPDAGYYLLPCWNDHQGFIPLTDLGAGYYMGYQGGLFPGGSNTDPNPHFNDGKNISKQIKPLDTLNNIDYINGMIALIGIGASVASDPFNVWKEEMNATDWPGVNKCLNTKGNFIGGKTMNDMLDPESDYWSNFLSGLANKNIAPNQVQVAWMLLMSETDTNDLDYFIDTVSSQYIYILHKLLDICPNLQQVFISGMHYSGYTAPEHKRYNYIREPYAYWNNLAIKNVIGRQINGDTALIYSGAGKNAPFITWGPYFWADGINPRMTDSLTWTCDNFRDDTIGGGFHLKDEYKFKESDPIADYFMNNAITKIWYKNSASWAGCDAARFGEETGFLEEEKLYVPLHDTVQVAVPDGLTGYTVISMYDNFGTKIFTDTFIARNELVRNYPTDKIPSGMYYMLMVSGDKIYSGRFTKQQELQFP